MARSTLLLITWMERIKKNRGKIELKMTDTETRGTKGREDPPVESWGLKQTPLLSKLLKEQKFSEI